MVKTLTRHGNSYALIIDKPILELLHINPDTPIEIRTDGDVLVLVPQRETERQAKFEEALDETNKRYGRALRNLAE
jgi:antitoxin component of MazEF toxin-antitoxin module